jgi:uncharacterized glyoxalase superfamily protein PhnB
MADLRREAALFGQRESTPMSPAKDTRATIVPSFRYRDARRAMEFLVAAFGFEKRAAYEGKDGAIEHAELTFGNGMIMLGTARESGTGLYLKHPDQTGGPTTGIYLVVTDADAHYARARAAGATIVREPVTQDYGGRDYACRDPEGYIWSFGTYDPWNPPQA